MFLLQVSYLHNVIMIYAIKHVVISIISVLSVVETTVFGPDRKLGEPKLYAIKLRYKRHLKSKYL
jgi:hypothetical protein